LRVSAPAPDIVFTGAYTVTGGAAWTCSRTDPGTMQCGAAMVFGAQFAFEAEVASGAPHGPRTVTARIDYYSPGGGADPETSNNEWIESTTIGVVGDIGWRVVQGIVRHADMGLRAPLAGVRVTCRQASYVPQPGSCAPGSVVTGPDGRFAFDVFVHDTDTIRLVADKWGYAPASRVLSGFDCAGRCPEVVLEMARRLAPALVPRVER